jgi:YfiH family protein
MTHPPFATVTALESPAIAHGFFGRQGGVSEGVYASLNAGPGSQDKAESVAENRARIATALGFAPEKLLTLYQIHSAIVQVVDKPLADMRQPQPERPQADAMVTKTPGLLLGILTADCTPILFADAKNGVVGAAHAGWKGAHANIMCETVKAMESLGARRENIHAAIGPCIHQPSYEVDATFRQTFLALADANEAFFLAGKEGRWQFDLPGYVAHLLKAEGIAGVHNLGHDTYTREAEYFSYRRTTHRKEPDYGRNLSVIGIR